MPERADILHCTESRSSFLRRLVLIAMTLNVLFVGLAGFWLWRSRMHYTDRASTTTQNLSYALGEHIADAVEKIDLIVRTLAAEVEKQLAVGGIDAKSLNEYIVRQQS